MIQQHVINAMGSIYSKNEGILRSLIPEDFDRKLLKCRRLPNGIDIFSYNGKDILEMHPLEFKPPDYTSKSVIMKVDQPYRIIGKYDE